MQVENNKVYIKCNGCKCLREEAEYEFYKGKRRMTCLKCKENRKLFRVKSKCIHNKDKSRCIECGGSEICSHNRIKSTCKECGGGSICSHNKIKSNCKECKGSLFCIHNRRKPDCKECGGSQICIHDKRKNICKECLGSQICIHDKRRNLCKECYPKLYMVSLVRGQVYRCFKISSLKKINHSISYLGCDSKTLEEHFKKKMTDEMTFDNIHIDHIKPVSKFNLDDEEEFLKCCHFTNLQPLLVKDNLELNNKWNDENELFWNENIIYKPNFNKLYKL